MAIPVFGYTAEPEDGRSIHEASIWLARERDAAWTAKLVILRVERLDDIRHFGECLREHQRHIWELAGWARTGKLARDSASLLEPSFVTREPHAIGALAESGAVLAAMESIEIARVAHYRSRDAAIPAALDRVLMRHLTDAHARLKWLRDRLRAGYAMPQAAAR
jgi:hypothetical protein